MGILVRNNKVISAGGKILYSRTGNPLELPNLKLYLSATRMVQQADESSVSSFTDFSGNSFHATQGTSGNQPKFDLNQFGSNAGIKFDGVDDKMNIIGGALDIFRNINQYTVQILTKRNTISDNCIDFYVTNNLNDSVRFAFGWVAGNAQLVVRRADSDPSVIITYPLNDTNYHLIQVTLNPANYTVYMYIDGVLVNSGVLLSAGYLGNTASGQVNVGYYNVTSYFGKSCINGISVNTSYSDPSTIKAQYRGYLQRGYL